MMHIETCSVIVALEQLQVKSVRSHGEAAIALVRQLRCGSHCQQQVKAARNPQSPLTPQAGILASNIFACSNSWLTAVSAGAVLSLEVACIFLLAAITRDGSLSPKVAFSLCTTGLAEAHAAARTTMDCRNEERRMAADAALLSSSLKDRCTVVIHTHLSKIGKGVLVKDESFEASQVDSAQATGL